MCCSVYYSAKLYSIKSEPRLCAYSKHMCDMSVVCDGKSRWFAMVKVSIIQSMGLILIWTSQRMKFSIIDFFNTCDQIRSFLQIWSHLLKKSLLKENFIFCAVLITLLSLCAKWFIHLFISELLLLSIFLLFSIPLKVVWSIKDIKQ